MCQILDKYEGGKSLDALKRDLNAEFGIIVHQAFLPFRDYLTDLHYSDLAILDTINELLNEHSFDSIPSMLEVLDQFYL
jgi:hypothetical protein